MSIKYNEYLKEHIGNVQKGYEWMKNNIPEIFEDIDWVLGYNMDNAIMEHDKSKYERDEYEAYDAYFYGKNKSFEVVRNFDKAWLMHIHRNPHHWQHWILVKDDPSESEILIDMPDEYIIEMICDWWSFSWKKGDLNEIFSWYEERKGYIKLSGYTYEKVNSILNMIKAKLQESGVNEETN